MRRGAVTIAIFSAALAISALTTTNTPPARAQSFAPQPTPVNREVIIRRVHVLDDMDDLTWGELTYRFRLMRRTSTCAGYACPGSGNEFRATLSESAPTGAVLNAHKVLGPIAMYPGEEMLVGMAGVEEDWNAPTLCPPVPLLRFDDSLCGAHDPLGVVHHIFAGPDFGIGTYSQTVYKGFTATYRVEFEVRQAGTATAPIMGGGGGSRTPTPSPTPVPTARPGMPPRHEP